MNLLISLLKPLVLVAGLSAVLWTQKDVEYDAPDTARLDPDFLIQGEYVATAAGMQVIAQGGGDFEIIIYAGGLPGAGWDRNEPQRVEGDSDTVESIVASRSFMRTERMSPTLNAPPPEGAVVLFDGSQQSLDQRWEEGARRNADGLLMQGATTKERFADYSLHIEFRTPFAPEREGQGRGNSGVYHQGRYETQVLDSFGMAGKNNETGGIYSVRDPDLNMCFPPLTWQTYDVEFDAARFDASGKKMSDAKMTVRLNGVVVQNAVAVPGITTAAPLQESSAPGPIHLQDHGNAIRYRNIWLVPRNAEQEARKPLLPGLERLYAHENLAGRLLVTQLACTACHLSEDKSLAAHRGPILDSVGSRIRFDHLLALTMDAHDTKPGTAMPNVFHALHEDEKKDRGMAIASFLASTGNLIDRPGDGAAAKKGEELYHSIGCVGCHAPRNSDIDLRSTSVPLGSIDKKYTLDSLAKFLANPHAIRPDGNMPKLVSSFTEARDIACYLLGDSITGAGASQFTAKVFHGSWKKLPDFKSLQPVKTGSTTGLDLSIAGRSDNFAIQFEAYLPIGVEGEYQFHLSSDDGSRLWIDDQMVVEVDGVHPVIEQSGSKRLSSGVHKIRIDYFEGGGGEDLFLDMEAPGEGRTPIAMLVTADPQGDMGKELIPSTYRPDPKLVSQGKRLFTQSGCANCHDLKVGGNLIASPLKAPKLTSSMNGAAGCLSEKVPPNAPQYDLSFQQKSAIRIALKSLDVSLDSAKQLHFTLASKNCYACHSRGTLGGPELLRDRFFTTRTPEMGNEGRLPPPLTGVGDKLQAKAIEEIISDGAKDRPYMVTRMPAFGKEFAKEIRNQLVELDQYHAEPKTQPHAWNADELKAMQNTGRKLVGSDGLSCVKCHIYGGKGAPGLQAIDLARMSERLSPDWFHRYLLAPTSYRPGTRMPVSFIDGKSTLTSIFDGDADKQIEAMWLYLAQGKDGRPPSGIDAEAIVLAPKDKPVIYRNFIEGLGPRGIAVGYPEKVNLAWDAGNMNLVLLWKDDFIDASKHWVGRGPGFQGPLGDDILKMDAGSLIAKIDSVQATWPKEQARELGFRFQGYQLDKQGQPTFRYRSSNIQVTDTLIPTTMNGVGNGFVRKLNLEIEPGADGFVCRIASGKLTKVSENEFRWEGTAQLKVEGLKFDIFQIGDRQELRGTLPVSGHVEIVETIQW